MHHWHDYKREPLVIDARMIGILNPRIMNRFKQNKLKKY